MTSAEADIDTEFDHQHEHEPSSSTSMSADDSTQRVQLKKWHAIALWSWDIEVDTCAICRNLIMV
jgi:RING-box protein 1